MGRTADNGGSRPVVVARTDLKNLSDRQHVNHGFFNARNSALPELPLRKWGKMPVLPNVSVAVQHRPKQ